MSLTVGSLFAGIGGFDIAAESLGWRTSWFVEWDAACRFWLAEHFPNRPIYGDITEVDFTAVEAVDVLCGGFPCPPVSAAGKRLGKRDPRWLWPQFERAIRDLRPRYVAIENVPGLLLSTGDDEFGQPLMGTVLGDLAALGYDAEWQVLSAADVGSPQERERVWIVAYTDRHESGADRRESNARTDGRHDVAGRSGSVGNPNATESGGLAKRKAAQQSVAGIARDHLGYADSGRREQPDAQLGDSEFAGAGLVSVGDPASGRRGAREGQSAQRTGGGCARVGSWRDGVPVRGLDGTVRIIPRDAAARGPESPLSPVAARLPGVVARHRAIGNAVVPKCVVEGPFAVIVAREAA